ncbi:isoprenyl transferase [Haloplasma contractile]|uniref:Isoprenyl transferase n=1 Tax=Haloplasma contractile SSD-17B TaxID=1033810 RepID=U2EEU2_9MOLU|nr:isoprenyl transferase [Haloplasma contractile]ERJ13473.1 Isoprenyl transferase protein [Haloplasma contractile SSD-17B]
MFFKNRNKKLKREMLTQIDRGDVPGHIAFIMDGNGRWAKKKGLPRTAGHMEGGKALLKTLEECMELGIKAVTVYAFSTENWKRPKEEVEYLMALPRKYINKYLPMLKERNVVMNFIGNIEALPEPLQNDIAKSIEETKDNNGIVFTIAINYGSQDELLAATKLICQDVKDDIVSITDINQDYFETKLFTNGLPPVDLLVRTSGEVRVSNFLLWQLAYTEFHFTDTLWPDFNQEELYKTILDYQNRQRRYGGLKGE